MDEKETEHKFAQALQDVVARSERTEQQMTALQVELQTVREENERLRKTAGNVISESKATHQSLSDYIKQLLRKTRPEDMQKGIDRNRSDLEYERRNRMELNERLISLERQGTSTTFVKNVQAQLKDFHNRVVRVENPEFSLPQNYKVVPLPYAVGPAHQYEQDTVEIFVDGARMLLLGEGKHEIDMDPVMTRKLLQGQYETLIVIMDGGIKNVSCGHKEATQDGK